jgi:predicted transcriptional regulator of viral defense system
MKYQEFQNSIKKPYFTRNDLVFQSLPVYDYQITLWQKKGYIQRVRNGLYVFSNRKKEVSPQEISFLLYEPSYISLESALSHYGIIPEIVRATTSISPRTPRTFSNSFGVFSYRHIKPELFFGYDEYETTSGKYLYAHLEKALLDYIYLNSGKIQNKDDIRELRINGEELRSGSNKKRLQRYLQEFHMKKMDQIISLIFEIC